MISATYGGNGVRLLIILTVKFGSGSIMLLGWWGFFWKVDWCASENRCHHEEGGLSRSTEARLLTAN